MKNTSLIHGSQCWMRIWTAWIKLVWKFCLCLLKSSFFCFVFLFFVFLRILNLIFRTYLHLFSSRWNKVLPFAFLTPWGKYKVIKKEPHWKRIICSEMFFGKCPPPPPQLSDSSTCSCPKWNKSAHFWLIYWFILICNKLYTESH